MRTRQAFCEIIERIDRLEYNLMTQMSDAIQALNDQIDKASQAQQTLIDQINKDHADLQAAQQQALSGVSNQQDVQAVTDATARLKASVDKLAATVPNQSPDTQQAVQAVNQAAQSQGTTGSAS